MAAPTGNFRTDAAILESDAVRWLSSYGHSPGKSWPRPSRRFYWASPSWTAIPYTEAEARRKESSRETRNARGIHGPSFLANPRPSSSFGAPLSPRGRL